MSDAEDGRLQLFYESSDESSRLVNREGRVEYLRTQRLLRAALDSRCRILDVGGGAGVHADWLAHDGHDVEVLDLVPHHVDAARARGLSARRGDARLLPYADDSFDALLLLGPLYHLIGSADRAAALSEAHRVVRPRGLIAAAAVTRIAVALDYLRKGRLDTAEAIAMTSRIIANGHDDTGFGAGIFYFHTVGELHDELVAAHFDDVRVHGIEGPAWPLIDPSTAGDDPIIPQVIAIAEMVDGDPTVTGASAHLLAIGHVS